MAATSEPITQISTAATAIMGDDVEIIEVEEHSTAPNAVASPAQLQATPSKTPSKDHNKTTNPIDHSNPSSTSSSPSKPGVTPAKMTLKQKQKEEEKLQRMKQREQERLDREKAKEEERLQKEKIRKEKEEERRKLNEEKERVKQEKKEKLLEEKRERERKKEEEKQKKEEERLKKIEEKRKAEELKQREEEEKKKKASKLQISNFFKPKSVVKSTVTKTVDVTTDANDADYKISFKSFYLRDTIRLKEGPSLCDLDDFDEQLKAPKTSLKEWFKQQDEEVQNFTSASYLFTHQLDAAPLKFKYIRFYENIKTYQFSYTKTIPQNLATNPFLITEAIYDFDQEENEDDEGEGEDIDDEDEEEDEDPDNDAEMSDFLDDVEENKNKRKLMGPLIPQIQWHSVTEFTVEILRPNLNSIDPHVDYWKTVNEVKEGVEQVESPKPKKSKSLITSKDDLEIFVKQVNDSDFTTPTMVELLKKQFSTVYTKSTIENTLKHFAKKVGPKATEKKWEVDMELLRKAMEL